MDEKDSSAFVAFFCTDCHQEIEASRDMVGQSVECPACGVKLIVPLPEQGPTPAQLGAMKSRTIRIELGDM